MKNKIATTASFLMLSVTAFAKTALESTKQDAVNTTSASSPAPWMPMVQLAITIAVVYCFIRFAGPKLLSKVGGKLNPKQDSLLQIQESATLAQGSLYVVSIYGQQYLVGAANSGINCLANLTEARMAFDSEQVFFEKLDDQIKEAPEEWHISNEIAEVTATSLDEISRQLSEVLTHAAIHAPRYEAQQTQTTSTEVATANRPPYWAVSQEQLQVKQPMTTPEPSTPAHAQPTTTMANQAPHRPLQNPFAEAMQAEQPSNKRSTVLSRGLPEDPLSRLDWITGGRSIK